MPEHQVRGELGRGKANNTNLSETVVFVLFRAPCQVGLAATPLEDLPQASVDEEPGASTDATLFCCSCHVVARASCAMTLCIWALGFCHQVPKTRTSVGAGASAAA